MEIDDMSTETIQKYLDGRKAKFELSELERLQDDNLNWESIGHYGWNHNPTIEIVAEEWNNHPLRGRVYVIKKNGYLEIIKHKDNIDFNIRNYFDNVEEVD